MRASTRIVPVIEVEKASMDKEDLDFDESNFEIDKIRRQTRKLLKR
jgi:hypothetical protein